MNHYIVDHCELCCRSNRRKYGLLEKKKDYLLRAKDFHKKEAAIKILRKKAEEKNPDEFYFAMEKSRTKDGVHVAPTAQANTYTADEIRLMKTQDVGYLTLKSQAEKGKIEKLKENLHLLGKSKVNKHTVFVDSEQDVASFDPSQHFDTPAELLDRTYNRPRTSQLAEPIVVSSTKGESLEKATSRATKSSKRAYEELEHRYARERALARTRDHLEVQRKGMAPGRKVKVSKRGQSVKQFRWKAERKR